MFTKYHFKSIVLSSFLIVFGFAYNASATDINTSATVVTSVTVAEVTPLNFGTFVPAVGAETITFDAGGTISAPSITFLGGEIGGEASTSGPASGDTVIVFVTGTTLTNAGGPDMPIRGNCLGPNGGGLGTDNGFCTFGSLGGLETVQIGAKLDVGAAAVQTGGIYTGVLVVVAGFY